MNKRLTSVTLIAIDTVDANRASRVLTYCSRLFDFKGATLYTNRQPSIYYDHRVQLIGKLDFDGVQNWELSQLRFAFDSDFCLYVQHDGWILNPQLWSDDFLNWDYVGAPWPRSWCRMRVGNSGFSLRSKAFCEATAASAHAYRNEGYDVFSCRLMHRRFIHEGIRYAPAQVAARFSWEHDCDDLPVGADCSFGFHGWVNGKKEEQYTRMLGTGVGTAADMQCTC
jgi:Protein of unknown function (DUF5672)